MNYQLTAKTTKRIFWLYTGCMVLTSAIPMDLNLKHPKYFWSTINPTFQNFLHIPMFVGFAFLLYHVLPSHMSRKGRFFLVLGVSIAISILLEGIQMFIPGRFPGLTDVAMNLFGALIGTVLFFEKAMI